MNKFLVTLLCAISISFANAATTGHASPSKAGMVAATTGHASTKGNNKSVSTQSVNAKSNKNSIKSTNSAWGQNRRGVTVVGGPSS